MPNQKPQPGAQRPGRKKGQTVEEKQILRPVVVVPGIMASELKNAAGVRVWPPINTIGGSIQTDPGLVDYLAAPEDLTAARDVRTDGGAPGIIGSVAYFDLLTRLRHEGWRESDGKLWFFEYNWGFKNLNSGDRLKEAIDYILSRPENRIFDKVDVVAHSMGGIVTRSAIKNSSARVRRTVYIASPHYGTPQAHAVLHPLINYKLVDGFLGLVAAQLAFLSFRKPSDPLTVADKLNQLAKDLPAAYELLPDEFYFSRKDWLFAHHRAPRADTPVRRWHNGYITRHETRFPAPPARALAEAAMLFKRDLGETLPGPASDIRVFYSASEITLSKTAIYRGALNNFGTYTESPDSGDGTVTSVSSKNGERLRTTATPVRGKHSGLPNDQAVLDPVVQFLKQPPP